MPVRMIATDNPKMVRSLLPATPTLLLLAVLLIFAGIPSMHMHHDEHFSWDLLRFTDIRELLPFLLEMESQHFFWMTVFWIWQQLVGDHEFVARTGSLLLGMLTLALVWRIGERWFGAWRFGFAAVLLLGTSAWFMRFALEVRPYSFVLLLGTLSMWAFQRWLQRRDRRSATLVALVTALMLYMHYFLVLLVMVQVVIFLLHTRKRRELYQGGAVAGLALLFWLPWSPQVLKHVIRTRELELASGAARGVAGIGTTTKATSWPILRDWLELATNGLVLPTLLLALAGCLILLRVSPAWRLALGWGLGLPALALLINLVFAMFAPRFIVSASPGIAVMAGATIASLPTRVRILALIVFVILMLSGLQAHMPVRVPLRTMFEEVAAAARPDDIVFFEPDTLGEDLIGKQVKRYLEPSLLAEITTDETIARQHRRIWYVTRTWFSDEVQERFARLEQERPLQKVLGRCYRTWCFLIQLLEGVPTPGQARFGPALEFNGMDLDLIDRSQLHTRLWWSALEPVPEDYSISLQVLNSAGVLVAQQDGPPLDWYSGSEIPVSTMTPGKILIDQRDIDLPESLPDGEYRLMLIVYRPGDLQRLTLDDGDDMLLLHTFRQGQ